MKKALLFLSLCSQAWSLSCSTPVTLSQPGQSGYWPKVKVNEKGEAVALWVAENEDQEEETLFAATMDGEKKWSSAEISKPAKDIFPHQLLIDAEGNSFVLWLLENEDNEGNAQKFYQFAKKEKNKSWSPTANVLSSEEVLAFAKSAFDAKGNVLFIGQAKTKKPDLKYSNTKTIAYDHQTGQKKHVELAKDAGFTTGESLFANKQGKVFASWQEYRSSYDKDYRYHSEREIKGSWYQDIAGWSKPVLISRLKDGYLLEVKGSINSKGDIAILWEKGDSNDLKRLQVVSCTDQQWSEPLDFAISENYFRNLQVAMNDQGDIVVGWIATEKGKKVVYVAQKSKEGSWSAPLALSDVSKKSDEFKISLDNEGNILAIWSAREGKKWVLQTSYQPKGQSWSSPISLSNKESSCEGAKVHANKTGNFVVLWEERQKRGSSVHSAALSVKTQQWSYAFLSPEGLDCSYFTFALNEKGEGVVAWKMTSNEEETAIQAAELKIN
jgi:hypothetical protein